MFITVCGFGQTGLNIRLNGSVDSVWTPQNRRCCNYFRPFNVKKLIKQCMIKRRSPNSFIYSVGQQLKTCSYIQQSIQSLSTSTRVVILIQHAKLYRKCTDECSRVMSRSEKSLVSLFLHLERSSPFDVRPSFFVAEALLSNGISSTRQLEGD